jgi:hypothetical protein
MHLTKLTVGFGARVGIAGATADRNTDAALVLLVALVTVAACATLCADAAEVTVGVVAGVGLTRIGDAGIADLENAVEAT